MHSLVVDGVALEAKWFGTPRQNPAIVMLHEGLGSVSTWRDFPERLAQATGMSVFAYSRAGYGSSSPAQLPRQAGYMHREALDVLPGVLREIGFRRGILLGHSDGASIAAIYGGSVQDHRVRGLILIEPHFFVEQINLDAIRNIGNEYRSTSLRERLQRHHADADHTFEGWRNAWLNPEHGTFDIRNELAYIRVPILLIKGEHDPYSTLAQLRAAEDETTCPVVSLVVKDAGHSPQREQPEITLDAIASFVHRLMKDHGEAALAG